MAENTVEIMKGTKTRIALERPVLRFTEGLASAVLAHNEMERVRGFSPTQWALGRSPIGINYSLTAATKLIIRVSWNIRRERKQPEMRGEKYAMKNVSRKCLAQETGHWPDLETKWTSGDVDKTSVHDHTFKAGSMEKK